MSPPYPLTTQKFAAYCPRKNRKEPIQNWLTMSNVSEESMTKYILTMWFEPCYYFSFVLVTPIMLSVGLAITYGQKKNFVSKIKISYEIMITQLGENLHRVELETTHRPIVFFYIASIYHFMDISDRLT